MAQRLSQLTVYFFRSYSNSFFVIKQYTASLPEKCATSLIQIPTKKIVAFLIVGVADDRYMQVQETGKEPQSQFST